MWHFLFFLSLLGISSVFILYPLLLRFRALMAKDQSENQCCFQNDVEPPTVTCIVVARNAESLIDRKIQNCLGLDYPTEKLAITLCSDGSTDRTAERMMRYAGERIHVQVTREHFGKIAALNRAVLESRSEILLFTDVDALLSNDSLRRMIRHYTRPNVGGVCGRRVIGEKVEGLSTSQNQYVLFSAGIQLLESRVGSITQSDGKIYTMRRALFRPIPDSVTDDFYTCMTVVSLGYRFLYEPSATATIHMPSRTLSHELERRRRIVSTSLRGIYFFSKLLNPRKYGLYSVGVFTNKIVRRIVPFLFVILFIANSFLVAEPIFLALLVLQEWVYIVTILAMSIPLSTARMPRLHKPFSLIAYFCIGNIGTLLGTIDFILGKTPNKWEPKKRASIA